MLAAAHAENESRKRRAAYHTKRSMRHIPQPDTTIDDAQKHSAPAKSHEDAQRLAQDNAQEVAQALAAKLRRPSVDAGIDTILQDIQTGGVQAFIMRRPSIGMLVTGRGEVRGGGEVERGKGWRGGEVERWGGGEVGRWGGGEVERWRGA